MAKIILGLIILMAVDFIGIKIFNYDRKLPEQGKHIARIDLIIITFLVASAIYVPVAFAKLVLLTIAGGMSLGFAYFFIRLREKQ